MNIANWLKRAGLSHGSLPAVAHGTRVVRSFAELAGRAARLAGALRARFDLAPGDRVAIFAKNSPEYTEALHAIWCVSCPPISRRLLPRMRRRACASSSPSARAIMSGCLRLTR
jgi:long-chain acyl-CoA synthetase